MVLMTAKAMARPTPRDKVNKTVSLLTRPSETSSICTVKTWTAGSQMMVTRPINKDTRTIIHSGFIPNICPT